MFIKSRKNRETQQVVLYNEDQKRVSVKNANVSDSASIISSSATTRMPLICSLCKRPLEVPANTASSTSLPPKNAHLYMDEDYFRHLEKIYRREQLAKPIPLPEAPASAERKIPSTAFNQGYYRKFFHEMERLGKGARGQVFRVQHVLENEYLGEYAVKKVPVGDNLEWLQRMLREVHIMETLRHPNVIAYKHAWLEVHQPTPFGPPVPCLFILMEYANQGNLCDLITTVRDSPKQFLPHPQVFLLFRQLCLGLSHLHQAGIIHRDLKPENILLHSSSSSSTTMGGELQLMITDFGECNTGPGLVEERTGDTGTIEFCAPELYRRNRQGNYVVGHSTSTDIWSLGMIFYYVLCGGRLPYSDVENVEVLKQEMLETTKITLPSDLRPDIPGRLWPLLAEILNIKASKRPPLSHILAQIDVLLESQNSTWSRPTQLFLGGRSIKSLRIFGLRYKFLKIVLVAVLLLHCYPKSIRYEILMLVISLIVMPYHHKYLKVAIALAFCLWMIFKGRYDICAC